MWGETGVLREDIRKLREEIAELRIRKDAVKKEIDLSDQVVALKRQISDLEVKKSQIEEQHQREDRELRHMIGLEKKRQEFEVEAAKKDAALTVRQENLDADKKRFETQLQFHQDRFTQEALLTPNNFNAQFTVTSNTTNAIAKATVKPVEDSDVAWLRRRVHEVCWRP